MDIDENKYNIPPVDQWQRERFSAMQEIKYSSLSQIGNVNGKIIAFPTIPKNRDLLFQIQLHDVIMVISLHILFALRNLFFWSPTFYFFFQK